MISKPDMAYLISIGAVKLPAARKVRKKHFTSTEFTRVRRAKFAAQGLNHVGQPPKKGGRAPGLGIDWKALTHAEGMKQWRALKKLQAG